MEGLPRDDLQMSIAKIQLLEGYHSLPCLWVRILSWICRQLTTKKYIGQARDSTLIRSPQPSRLQRIPPRQWDNIRNKGLLSQYGPCCCYLSTRLSTPAYDLTSPVCVGIFLPSTGSPGSIESRFMGYLSHIKPGCGSETWYSKTFGIFSSFFVPFFPRHSRDEEDFSSTSRSVLPYKVIMKEFVHRASVLSSQLILKSRYVAKIALSARQTRNSESVRRTLFSVITLSSLLHIAPRAHSVPYDTPLRIHGQPCW